MPPSSTACRRRPTRSRSRSATPTAPLSIRARALVGAGGHSYSWDGRKLDGVASRRRALPDRGPGQRCRGQGAAGRSRDTGPGRGGRDRLGRSAARDRRRAGAARASAYGQPPCRLLSPEPTCREDKGSPDELVWLVVLRRGRPVGAEPRDGHDLGQCRQREHAGLQGLGAAVLKPGHRPDRTATATARAAFER